MSVNVNHTLNGAVKRKKDIKMIRELCQYGKQASIEHIRVKSDIDVDPQIETYLKGLVDIDSMVYFKHDGGFLVLPYTNGQWNEDKLYFYSVDKIHRFATKVGVDIDNVIEDLN